ncbi:MULTISPECIES: hypothetical protein [Streptomyces]|uniref:Uncharacterized protein n=2 Tax=Streptomyces TaxID=1883 RepID=A0A100Y647_9ACTN|nr:MULTISPECIES: hypothetical protein [Streptomyces]KUH38409.1 hypothetical protein ATE80_13145 [Streptomyces kanasensis]UUS30856.1 hypothetical protein NRO40_08410 [Streptomyces changanensis]
MTDLARILDTGLGWLYDTVQPDDAHQQHHGIQLHLPEANRWYGFCPSGAQHRPVVSVDVINVEWVDNGPNTQQTPANPLEPGELPALVKELYRRGFESTGTWNGHPGVSGSVGLVRPAHPTLVAAVDRYRHGCPLHPNRSVFCDCEQWTAGFGRVVRPDLRPTPAVARSAEDAH